MPDRWGGVTYEPFEPAQNPKVTRSSPAASGSRSGRSGTLYGQKRRRPRGRLLTTLGLVFVLIASATVVLSKVLESRYEGSLRQDVLLAPWARGKHGHIHGPLNYLVVGSDLRADNPGGGQRSDTIIIVHVPASMDHAYLISVPRDLRVHIPPYPAAGFGGSTEKINAAFDYGSQNGQGERGGYQLLSLTLAKVTGLHFDGAVIVDFNGFQKVVDQLGGVTMCVDTETQSIHTGAIYHVGCQRMKSWQALDYVRQRDDLPNGDFDRQRHEQQFLKAILQEARNQGVASNPVKLDSILRAVGQSLTVDTNGAQVSDVVYALRKVNANSLTGVRLPSYSDDVDDVSYVLPDDKAASLYAAVRQDGLAAWVAANPTWMNSI